MTEIKHKDYDIIINDQVIDIIKKYIQSGSKLESGGMLIGSFLVNGNMIEINDITEPQKEDKSSRFGFYRSDKHNELLSFKWKESNYTKMYLGEWHTHPQQIPKPSLVDKSSWKKLLKSSITDSNLLIFIIVGFTCIEVWIGDRSSNKIERGGNFGIYN
ncbi:MULTISPECIES: Mov34/MPN/PAD-1 family protein [Clostridia]|uniref:Mov34/MPN/PAD-1 family protein n=1 Tax=Clostridia TaxID=186801 RepID=UPI0005E1F459|nr:MULTISPECIES: Mov34/MPN/PAD-1 family protein [Clostridia]NGT88453.1 hypothetical protein [Clostridium perfringens]CEP94833.1 conserved hypothetical protein [[Clostridium] sordellii] [Paeniclostridium sordellii]VTQ56180.1 Uncharacterised protein [Clostridium perfringens]